MRTKLDLDKERDPGAVLVWVAVSMVVLIGMGALVIDIGALYWEKRQLQNGADAAALAVAQDCAEGDCLDEYSTADSFADRNAKDGATNIDGVCGSGPGLTACPATPPGTTGASGWVQVDDSTATPGGGDEVDFFLAPVLNAVNQGSTVHAKAVAAWGPLGSGSTLPLTYSACEFTKMGGSIDGRTFPSGTTTIFFHDTTEAGPPCPQGPSGADLPGGFGWLESSGCRATITAGGWVNDKPGVAVPRDCNLSRLQNLEVAIPVFSHTNGLNGRNGSYLIVGFTGFVIRGYSFPSNRWSGSAACPLRNPSIHYVCGEFTRVSLLEGDFGGPDLGARVIRMIG